MLIKKAFNYIVCSIIIFIIYAIFVNSLNREEAFIGVIIGLIGAFFLSKELKKAYYILHPMRIIFIIIYIPILLWEMLKSNLHIAMVVLKPSLPVRPSIVRARMDLKKPLSQLLLSSSITLTPGTLTLDIDDNDNIYIHCVDEEKIDELSVKKNILNKFEKYIKRFAE